MQGTEANFKILSLMLSEREDTVPPKMRIGHYSKKKKGGDTLRE